MTSEAVAAALDRAVSARTHAAVALLERLVAQPSEVGREAGAVAELAQALAALGFAVEEVAIGSTTTDDPASGVPVVEHRSGRGPIVARRAGTGAGTGARSLLVNGHLDVVPPGSLEQWAGDPYRLRQEDGWLIGRGAGDMKGGIAMAVLAIEALLDVLGDDLAGDLTVVGAIEEECTGNGTLATVHAGVLADAVVLPEPTGLDILSAGVGVLWLELSLEAPGGHAETAGDRPSALELAAALVGDLRTLEGRLADGRGGPRYRVNVGRLRAGDWTSSLPTSASLDVRMGFPTGWTAAEAQAWAREAIDDLMRGRPGLADRGVGLRASGLRAEGYALPETSELLLAVRDAHLAAHGRAPAVVTTEATTDARFYLNQAGVPALCFGPRARALHAPEEGVELDSIVQGARTLARFMAAWLTAGEVVL